MAEYTVKLGSAAWTVDYVDSTGTYSFAFECDIDEYDRKGATKKLFLQRSPPVKDMKLMECSSEADLARIALIVERVKEHMSSLGYEVEVIG